jgi:integrase
MTPKAILEIVKEAAGPASIEKFAPHDPRRTCARLCHVAGGELDQIQFLLGHVSIQTTKCYVGCKQKLQPPSTTTRELSRTTRADSTDLPREGIAA